jgi:hypothetical protein
MFSPVFLLVLSLFVAGQSPSPSFTSQVSIAFYYSRPSPAHSHHHQLFTNLAASFTDSNVRLIVIDINSTTTRPPVSAVPSIHASLGREYLGAYFGNWSEDSIRDFIWLSLTAFPRPRELSSVADLLMFQRTEPVNIVIFSERGSAFSTELLSALGSRTRLLPIASCPSDEIANDAGIPMRPLFVITRPLDGVQVPVQRYSRASLLRRIQPLITPIQNGVLGDIAGGKWTLAVLLDRANASHWQRAGDVFRHCGSVFGKTVAYQSCDFFDCPALIQLCEVTNASEPIFIAFRKDGTGVRELVYREKRVSPTAVRLWLRAQVQRQQADEAATKGRGIPVIPATRFAEVVGNKSSVTIMLIGSIDRDYYNTLKKLDKARGKIGIDNVALARFYRFDPVLQPTGKLPIVERAGAWVAVYFAGSEKCAFPANVSVDAMSTKLSECFAGET